ncbi:anion permease, partial [Aliarcobacter butzleri]
MSKQTLKLFVPIIVAIALWFVPAPEGLTQNAWHFLAIFFAVVV